MTTLRRRRQKEAVDSFSSWTSDFLVVTTPMSYSLQRVCENRVSGWAGGCRATLFSAAALHHSLSNSPRPAPPPTHNTR